MLPLTRVRVAALHQGNINPSIYSSVPDHRLSLTANGRSQAIAAGIKLKNMLVGGSRVGTRVRQHCSRRVGCVCTARVTAASSFSSRLTGVPMRH